MEANKILPTASHLQKVSTDGGKEVAPSKCYDLSDDDDDD